MLPSTTQVQHLQSVNEYNVDCSFETQLYTILGTKYIISMAMHSTVIRELQNNSLITKYKLSIL